MALHKGGCPNAVNAEFAQSLPRRFLALLDEEIKKCESHGSPTFGLLYQRESFLSKYVSSETDSPETRRDRAIAKWLGVELRNKRTNDRLFTTESTLWDKVTTTHILQRAGRIVESILGATPPERFTCRFSGGATTSRKRQVGTLYSKYVGRLDATPRAVPYFLREVSDSIWTNDPEVTEPRLVKGNVLFTVPKKTDIDRVACKEPDVNVFLQKGVGLFIRNRLNDRCRIDLRDQSVNRELAREASRTGHLATIDLSSASDSLTDSLVRWLVPPAWYELLDAIRSPKTFIGDTSVNLEMFSSMGNGFTFELESLVFFALAKATSYYSGVRGRISVYGDDLIVPTPIFRRFLNVLRFCGFTPNTDKTFGTGYFRESCGGHYYRGVDVSPFFLRRPIKEATDLILFLNQLRSWIIRMGLDWEPGQPGSDPFADTPFTAFWREGSRYVRRSLHGGHEPGSRYQLVSPGKPVGSLHQITRTDEGARDKLSLGAYLSRLHEMDISPVRDGVLPAPIDPFAVHTARWEVRRVRDFSWTFGLTKPLFVQEQHNWWFLTASGN